MISRDRIEAIKQAARRYGPANCWTGTSGMLSAMIIELLNERESEGMNRQTRLEGSKEWHSHGNVTFFEAIKKEAKQVSRRNNLCEATWVIECRCESEPDKIDTFTVQVTLHAEILDPRKGA